MAGNGTRYTAEFKAEAVRRVVEEFQSPSDVSAQMGASESAISYWANAEKRSRRQAAQAARQAVAQTATADTTVKELRETVADLRGKVRTYEYTFSLIREALIEAENQTGQ